jgi:hypothetical protein
MPPVKQAPDKAPEDKAPENKAPENKAPDTTPASGASENGSTEITQQQMTDFNLALARKLKEEKEHLYKRIQFNRARLRGDLEEPDVTDEQRKEINALYPEKKGGGRPKKDEKKSTDTAPAKSPEPTTAS